MSASPGGGSFPGGGFAGFNGENGMSALDEAGCGAQASIIEMGPAPSDLQNPHGRRRRHLLLRAQP